MTTHPIHNNPLTRLPERTRLLVLSFAVGVCAGLAAVLLTWCIGSIKSLLDGNVTLPYNLQYLILPGIGMFITLLLLRYVVPENIGHGVTKVLLAVSRGESKIRPHNMWSSMLTSSITIGFGGSVGAEAPIVYTGAAIGSNIGRFCDLPYRHVTVLLGCGAAGAIAGIFKAPLAGVLFTMEILLLNMSLSSMLPLLISTISATVVAYIFRGQTPMFACTLTPFSMWNIPFYLIMGVMMGFGSLYFTRVTLWMEDKIGKLGNRYVRWILCSLSLGVMIFLFPQLYGEGYGVVSDLLNGRDISDAASSPVLGFLTGSGWGLVLLFLMVFLIKVPAMTATNAGGGNGGTFGPTLFCGAIAGFVLARCFNLMGANVPEQNFVLVGMAALMAGVMQAPMTAIFLIAEISGGYALLIPLILTATVSYGTTRLFEKYSIYSKRIAQSGDLLTHDNDQAVLTLMSTRSLVRDKYPRVLLDGSLRSVVEAVQDNNAAVVAVLDGQDRFQGYIDVGNIRKYLLRTDLYDEMKVVNVMEQAPALITEDEKMESVMRKFDTTGAWRLPVVDATRHYKGFISRSRLLIAYRAELKEIQNSD